jgi:hypothetical protein
MSEILNGLIQFTLFLTGKFNSKVEQIESRTASWNGLCSTFEGPLYNVGQLHDDENRRLFSPPELNRIYEQMGRLVGVYEVLYPAPSRLGNVPWILFQEGQSSNLSYDAELGTRHTLAVIPTSSVLVFIRHKQ